MRPLVKWRCWGGGIDSEKLSSVNALVLNHALCGQRNSKESGVAGSRVGRRLEA